MEGFVFVLSGRGIPLGVYTSYQDAVASLMLTVDDPKEVYPLHDASPDSGFCEFNACYQDVPTRWTITAVKPSDGPEKLFRD